MNSPSCVNWERRPAWCSKAFSLLRFPFAKSIGFSGSGPIFDSTENEHAGLQTGLSLLQAGLEKHPQTGFPWSVRSSERHTRHKSDPPFS